MTSLPANLILSNDARKIESVLGWAATARAPGRGEVADKVQGEEASTCTRESPRCCCFSAPCRGIEAVRGAPRLLRGSERYAREDSASHYPWVIAMRVERQISGLQQLCET